MVGFFLKGIYKLLLPHAIVAVEFLVTSVLLL
jgi:hypothetical protein